MSESKFFVPAEAYRPARPVFGQAAQPPVYVLCGYWGEVLHVLTNSRARGDLEFAPVSDWEDGKRRGKPGKTFKTLAAAQRMAREIGGSVYVWVGNQEANGG